ncbi:ESPR-type extended signal peptide-containing protein [Neisseria meningitidis]|uniref:autotransporter adhesin NhhA n=1 Tax=Neisseria meningitidis TaxID=487 RepID=UPI0030990BB4
MNKIYRIIWNSALNAWVVVSELTRNHTKRASATVATAVLATLLFATVQANATDDDDLYLEPVQRTAVVLSFRSDKEGTGEKEGTEDSNWAVYFDEKRVLKAGAITLKAGDNLKIKQNTNENTNENTNDSSFTYSLKKDLTDLTSVETEKLSFGANGNKVNITSDTKGLNFAKETAGTNGDPTVHLNGIGSTLTDTLAGSSASHVDAGNQSTHYTRAASIKDVLNAGWNIKGVKTGSTTGQSENVDFVRTYDTVEFLSADTKTTTVNVESKDNGKRTEVKIGAKTSVIAEENGKLVTGKGDEGKGLVTAKTVIDAVNKSGWRVKTTDNNQTGQADKFETVTSGTNVTFASGKGTTATVSKDDQGNITVKYDVNVGDALNVNQLQNSGWNLDSKAVAGSSGKVISGNVSPSKGKMDETVNINAGNNIEITRNGKNIDIATSMAPQFSSVSLGAGADAPTLSVDDEGALNVGSKDTNKPVRITNVAPGVKEGDVTNVAQLKGVAQNLNNRIDNVDGNARAGIAQAIATAGLVQAYLPGKSMMAIGGGTYRGEAGYAIGYSSISDGGNWIIKGTASGNSRGHFGASASVGYQW